MSWGTTKGFRSRCARFSSALLRFCFMCVSPSTKAQCRWARMPDPRHRTEATMIGGSPSIDSSTAGPTPSLHLPDSCRFLVIGSRLYAAFDLPVEVGYLRRTVARQTEAGDREAVHKPVQRVRPGRIGRSSGRQRPPPPTVRRWARLLPHPRTRREHLSLESAEIHTFHPHGPPDCARLPPPVEEHPQGPGHTIQVRSIGH